MILGLALFSLVALSLYRGFSLGVLTWRAETQANALSQQARATFDVLARSLRNAQLLYPGSFQGQRQKVSWIGLLPEIQRDNQVRPVWTRLGVDLTKTENGRTVLSLHKEPLGLKGVRAASADIPLTNVNTDIVFQYGYKNEGAFLWTDRWENGKGIPRLIKIQLALKPPETQNALTLVKVVQIPHGVFQ